MEVVILAGGLGTRLRSVLPDIPKPMAPVEGKPFLWYLFKWISGFPVSKIVLSIGYKSELIIDYFGSSFGKIPLKYAIEEKPIGTGGGLINAMKYISATDFLVVNGDTFFPVDIKKLFVHHAEHVGFITVALKNMLNFSRYGAVECAGGFIVGFHEKKKCNEGLINGGIYAINRKMLITEEHPVIFSFEKEILERNAGMGNVRFLTFTDPFIDIGVPEDYNRAGEILKHYLPGI